ncbi:hypothetical protein J2S43_003748 [Catenuloplanes nepalensis]|uniref:Uncharacterized protein n=1 Tax=Catenuloplanes nepalensis TaxID=587533 RepID=A0ABT9MUW1_9ACTN|nr:hypothetical protein [Catenuloplanes nepalensis]MDP9795236.1 hypothetical protein [Catenuloplanes nepalensis]
MKFDALTWSSAGAWTARWAAGAVLGQIIFGPTTMLFIALVTGVAAGAGAMFLIHRRTASPRATTTTRRRRSSRVRGRAPRRAPVAVVSARLAALAARSWRALRRPRVTRPTPPGPPPARRYSPRAPKRSFSPLAPR